MSDNIQFNLVGIFRAIFRKKRFVLLLTAAATVLSIVFCLLQTERYTSETIFIVKNPILIDRNYVFRNTSYEHKEFFAIADDVDHIKTIGKSDGIIWYLAEKFDFGKLYGISDPDKLFKKVKSNFKLTSDDTKNVELFFTDPDPVRAKDVTLAAREYIESMFRNYFVTTNKGVTEALSQKAQAISDTLNVLNDAISALKHAKGEVSVAGKTLRPEQLEETLILKEQLSKDLANYHTLINEYEVMITGKVNVFYVVQDAGVPHKPSHPQTLIIVAASFLGSLFFACFIVLFREFYRVVMEGEDRP